MCDGLASVEGVHARAFLSLQLEQLEQAHCLVRGGHQPEPARRMGQHHACGGHAEQVDASPGESGQQVDDVVVVDERVRHLDE